MLAAAPSQPEVVAIPGVAGGLRRRSSPTRSTRRHWPRDDVKVRLPTRCGYRPTPDALSTVRQAGLADPETMSSAPDLCEVAEQMAADMPNWSGDPPVPIAVQRRSAAGRSGGSGGGGTSIGSSWTKAPRRAEVPARKTAAAHQTGSDQVTARQPNRRRAVVGACLRRERNPPGRRSGRRSHCPCKAARRRPCKIPPQLVGDGVGQSDRCRHAGAFRLSAVLLACLSRPVYSPGASAVAIDDSAVGRGNHTSCF